MVCGEKSARLYKNIQISLYSSVTSLSFFSVCIGLGGRFLSKCSEEMLQASGQLLFVYMGIIPRTLLPIYLS